VLYIAKWHVGLLLFGFQGSVICIFSDAGCLPKTLFEQTSFDGYRQDLLVIVLLFVCLFVLVFVKKDTSVFLF
jgi:hypothetical protein